MPADITRMENEREEQHQAFLLWVMQDPKLRKIKPIGRAVGRGQASPYKWASRLRWAERIAEQAGDHVICQQAAELYAHLYHEKVGAKQVMVIIEWMTATYRPPHKTGTELAQEALSFNERDTGKPIDENESRRRRLTLILDAGETLLAEKLLEKDEDGNPTYEVSLADLPRIVNARKVFSQLYGQTRAADMEHAAQGPVGSRVDRSERVIQAQERKDGTVLDAIYADADEMRAIIDILKADESVERSNVVPFPSQATTEAEGG